MMKTSFPVQVSGSKRASINIDLNLDPNVQACQRVRSPDWLSFEVGCPENVRNWPWRAIVFGFKSRR
jgi:hypothetical protein